MQTRPYPEKNGLRIWLARSEQRALLEAVDDEPRRRIALQLGLHGLRTDEILQVEPRHFRELTNGADGHVLTVPEGKTGKREAPISDDLVDRVRYLKSATRLRADEQIVDVSKRSVRNWIADARQVLVDDTLEEDLAGALGMNFLVVPAVVYGLTRFLPQEPILLVGAFMVLLTPCIDYVITFTDLAGGTPSRSLLRRQRFYSSSSSFSRCIYGCS